MSPWGLPVRRPVATVMFFTAVILMGLIEANGGSRMFLYVVGDLLVIARIAHLVGLKHDNMAHKGRAIGAGGTALVTAASGIYALWLSVPAVIASFQG